MRSVLTWQVNAADGQAPGNSPVVYDCCFNPAGTQLVVACGNLVLVYDATDGLLMHRLRGHKDTVYCVTYSKDGKRFASGGADKQVIIWKNTAEGILKYGHNDSIQALSYNPVTLQLASVTAGDYGVWSPEAKSVSKHKLSAKGLCCSWSNDGTLLAIGQFDGTVTVRGKDGAQKFCYRRSGPVWCLAFNPSTDDGVDVLAVAAWDRTLVYYKLADYSAERKPEEQAVQKAKMLDMDPCSLRYFQNGEYMTVGGSDNKAHLMTKDGVRLQAICERASWIWSAAPRPKQNYVAVGCNDGTVAVYQLVFATVHGLYQERYAYRDLMTNVIVQHLTLENKKVMIPCKDHVKKIAVYKDRLAVQLPERVVVYELKGGAQGDNASDMQYKKKDTINKALDCNLLVVTHSHIILCLERKLQLLNFAGDTEREWVLDAVIRYIKVVGGPPRREGLLVGLKNGQVLKIYVDNLFPIPVVAHDRAIRCLDLSPSRGKLALVDQNATVVVYDMQTQEKLFEDTDANSVAWNSVLEGQLCYSGKKQLCVKTGDFPVHRERLQGYVVGVRGSKVFCLHYLAMHTVNVPQSASMYRYLEQKAMQEAYTVATMGVTDADWKMLGYEALMQMELEVAAKAFIKVRDMRSIDLINRIKVSRRLPGHSDQVFMAEAMALSGQLQEARKLYVKCGRVDLAIKLFSDLKRWEDAREIAEESQGGGLGGGHNVLELTREQAQWAIESKDWKTAASILVTSEEYPRAIEIMDAQGMTEELVEVVRRLDKTDAGNLSRCAEALRRHGAGLYAKEAYVKMGNTAALVEVYADMDRWEDAIALLDQHPELADRVYLPYAGWLANNDRFEEAQEYLRRAGDPHAAIAMLARLSEAAVTAQLYKDAAYFIWMLAAEKAKLYPPGCERRALARGVAEFREDSDRAEIYFGYHTVHAFITQAFNTQQPESVFNAARFLLQKLQHAAAPRGVQRSFILWAMAEQATKLECFKVARRALDQLRALRLPAAWQDKVDLACIRIRGKELKDRDDLLSGEDVFTGERSFIHFEVLPLVEFQVERGISADEAQELLKRTPAAAAAAARKGGGRAGGSERATAAGNMLTFDEDDDDDDATVGRALGGGFGGNSDDPVAQFQQRLLSAGGDGMLVANRELLQCMSPDQVVIQRAVLHACPDRYFSLIVPDTPVVVCRACGHMFSEDDLEMEFLKTPQCVFCRSTDADALLWPG